MLHITKGSSSSFIELEESTYNEVKIEDENFGQTIGHITDEERTYSVVKHLCPNANYPSQVIFGSGLEIFTHRLLLLDALSYNSGGLYRPSLVRNIQSKFEN